MRFNKACKRTVVLRGTFLQTIQSLIWSINLCYNNLRGNSEENSVEPEIVGSQTGKVSPIKL